MSKCLIYARSAPLSCTGWVDRAGCGQDWLTLTGKVLRFELPVGPSAASQECCPKQYSLRCPSIVVDWHSIIFEINSRIAWNLNLNLCSNLNSATWPTDLVYDGFQLEPPPSPPCSKPPSGRYRQEREASNCWRWVDPQAAAAWALSSGLQYAHGDMLPSQGCATVQC